MPSKLSKTCLELLSSAHALETGILLLPPGRFEDLSKTTSKAIERLLRLGLVSRQGDQIRLTDAGRATAEPADRAATRFTGADMAAANKITLLLNLVQQEGGATVINIVDATGWLPHSIRAAISGLRKRGHVIELVKIDGTRRYQATSK